MLEYDVIITCVGVEGTCGAGYKGGEKIIIKKGRTVDLEESDLVCYWVLSSIMPFILPISTGKLVPKEIGMDYVTCPGGIPSRNPLGARVMFKIERKKSD